MHIHSVKEATVSARSYIMGGSLLIAVHYEQNENHKISEIILLTVLISGTIKQTLHDYSPTTVLYSKYQTEKECTLSFQISHLAE
jgi:hypothetical protein